VTPPKTPSPKYHHRVFPALLKPPLHILNAFGVAFVSPFISQGPFETVLLAHPSIASLASPSESEKPPSQPLLFLHACFFFFVEKPFSSLHLKPALFPLLGLFHPYFADSLPLDMFPNAIHNSRNHSRDCSPPLTRQVSSFAAMVQPLMPSPTIEYTPNDLQPRHKLILAPRANLDPC